MMTAFLIVLGIYGALNCAIVICACVIRVVSFLVQLPAVIFLVGLEEIRARRQRAGAKQLHPMQYFTGE